MAVLCGDTHHTLSGHPSLSGSLWPSGSVAVQCRVCCIEDDLFSADVTTLF